MTQDATATAAGPPLQPFASPSAVTPPPGAQPSPVSAQPSWRPLRGLARALSALFVVAAGVELLVVATIVNRLQVLADLSGDRVGFDNFERVSDADDIVRTAGIVWLLVTLGTAAVFIVWMWRAAKNNEALGRDHPRLGPEWAVAGWFIPLANFVMPVLVMQDLWRGSTARIPRGDMRWRIADRSALVGWWWGTWIVTVPGGADALFGAAEESSTLDALRASDAIAVLAGLLGIAAAVLAILVVRRLTARQEETLRAQQAAWAAVHRE